MFAGKLKEAAVQILLLTVTLIPLCYVKKVYNEVIAVFIVLGLLSQSM